MDNIKGLYGVCSFAASIEQACNWIAEVFTMFFDVFINTEFENVACPIGERNGDDRCAFRARHGKLDLVVTAAISARGGVESVLKRLDNCFYIHVI